MKKGRSHIIVILCCFMLVPAPGIFAQNRQAVMVTGNTWITGNPGFGGENITALFGEYRVEFPGEIDRESPYTFTVRVCIEPGLLTAEGWQLRPGSSSLLQRQEKPGLLIGFPFSGGVGLGVWTVIFCFPPGSGAELQTLPDGLGNADINRLINAWTERFYYFFSLIKVSSDMSLPAVFGF